MERPGPGERATFRSLESANKEIGRLRALVSWLHRYYERRLIEERARRKDTEEKVG